MSMKRVTAVHSWENYYVMHNTLNGILWENKYQQVIPDKTNKTKLHCVVQTIRIKVTSIFGHQMQIKNNDKLCPPSYIKSNFCNICSRWQILTSLENNSGSEKVVVLYSILFLFINVFSMVLFPVVFISIQGGKSKQIILNTNFVKAFKLIF